MERIGDRRRPQQSGDAGAARRVGLQDVDRPRLAYPPEVDDVVTVFTGGDVEGRRRTVAHEPQPVEIVAHDRLFEPAHAEIGIRAGERERLLAAVRAIGIDE